MDDTDVLAGRFEEHRPRLRAMAYRMLGSAAEADDAVQEGWLRLDRSDAGRIENLGGWLTTVVGRVCLTMLESRRTRREDPIAEDGPDPAIGDEGADPEVEALQADSVGVALAVVLETLTPPERLAFVLHDLFAVPFEDVAPIVDRSPAAARQLASRARRRVQGAEPAAAPDPARRREAVRAFLAASRDGDFDGLVAMLAPDVVLRSDPAAVAAGGRDLLRGPLAVAEQFSGKATAAQPALVNGIPAAVWAPGGKVRVVVAFAFSGDTITGIELMSDRAYLDRMDIQIQPR